MKKIYTFITAAFLAASMSVSAQKVSLRVDNNYEVKIDGRNYGNNAVIPGFADGSHEVQLYKVEKAFLGKKRTLVTTDRFEMRNNDVNIDVDQYGKLRINGSGDFNRRNRDDRNRDDNEYNENNGNGKGYGKNNNPGRGNKYGHYKNKKSKKTKDSKDDRDDDRDDDRYEKRNEKRNDDRHDDKHENKNNKKKN